MDMLPGIGPEPAQVPVLTRNSPMYIDISSDSFMSLDRSDSQFQWNPGFGCLRFLARLRPRKIEI
ncbi:unnamed protein product [Arabis nemorensis]|uniref:Uncharacterized protein n=1 Tax=Arabis nemorensis TaxID=586526 RepID=A0A565C911_9BRAS|nr:unnamed protein product [Arabis nemorensis]